MPNSTLDGAKLRDDGWPPAATVRVVAIPPWVTYSWLAATLIVLGLLSWIGYEVSRERAALDRLCSILQR